MSKELFDCAGKLEQELNEATLEKLVAGNVSGERSWLSDALGNDGKYCTVTWECSICPTHTCFC